MNILTQKFFSFLVTLMFLTVSPSQFAMSAEEKIRATEGKLQFLDAKGRVRKELKLSGSSRPEGWDEERVVKKRYGEKEVEVKLKTNRGFHVAENQQAAIIAEGITEFSTSLESSGEPSRTDSTLKYVNASGKMVWKKEFPKRTFLYERISPQGLFVAVIVTCHFGCLDLPPDRPREYLAVFDHNGRELFFYPESNSNITFSGEPVWIKDSYLFIEAYSKYPFRSPLDLIIDIQRKRKWHAPLGFNAYDLTNFPIVRYSYIDPLTSGDITPKHKEATVNLDELPWEPL